MSKNMVIYHRNNRTLEIQNHIDNDGDLDPNYVMLRNTGLTGNKQRFKWLTECASKGCPICSGIFEPDSSKWVIKKWYIDNVVNPQLELKNRIIVAKPKKTEKAIALKNKFDAYIPKQRDPQEDDHPLLELIIKKFNGKIIK